MTSFKRMHRWLMPPLVAALLASTIGPAVYANGPASPLAVPSCDKERGRPPDRPIPPGQLKRRGVVGTVVAVDADAGTITVETQFGNVEMATPDGFNFDDVEEGDRIASLLTKDPEETVDPTATDTPFRIGTASKIKIVPGKASYTHDEAVILGQEGDTIEVLDEDGNSSNVGVTGAGGVQGTPTPSPTPDPTPTESPTPEPPDLVVEPETVEAGTDAILLVQCSGAGATAEVRSIQRADRIAERLERLQAEFADNPEKAAKFEELQQRREDREQARLEKTSKNVPPSAQGKVDKARGKGRTQECIVNADGVEQCTEDTGPGKSGDKGGDKGGGQGGDKGGDKGGQGGGGQGGGNKK